MSNAVTIDLGVIHNSCFVAMPFSPLFQNEYEKVIRPAVEATGLLCIRGDEIYGNQRIMNDIWHSIRSSRLIIAELTGKNPNVLYEIGLAHAIGKPIIIITRNSDDVPFDLKDLRYLFYDINDPLWGDNLKRGIQSLIEKAISNIKFDKYLEGVSHDSQKIEIHPEKPESHSITDELKPLIKGLWTGKFISRDITYNINLNITYKNQELVVVSITKYYFKETVSSVEQLMTAAIENNKIYFKGVNYTYLERGKSGDYLLDSYELTFHDDYKKMIGKIISGSGFETNIVFEKNNTT